jgi:RNA polymerase sigma factor (TIGR02999 family)
MPLVYDQLRRMARARIRRERPGHLLDTTALVHEAYLRLVDQREVRWQNRAHFFAIAAQLMRRILVDHARRKAAAKRGGDVEPAILAAPEWTNRLDVLELDDALTRLAALDPRQGRIRPRPTRRWRSLLWGAAASGKPSRRTDGRWSCTRARDSSGWATSETRCS